jgi:hypothetical protein
VRQGRISTHLAVTTAIRAGWGCALLFAPGRVLRLGGRPPAPTAAIRVARVLGARQVLQSIVTLTAPTGTVAGLGAATDALHVGTCVALAATSPRWRTIALLETGLGAGFAASGWNHHRDVTASR